MSITIWNTKNAQKAKKLERLVRHSSDLGYTGTADDALKLEEADPKRKESGTERGHAGLGQLSLDGNDDAHFSKPPNPIVTGSTPYIVSTGDSMKNRTQRNTGNKGIRDVLKELRQ